MMSFLETVRWDVVGGGFQIVLCAVILGGWLRRRLKKGTKAHAEAGAPPPVFSQEVLVQTLRQESEQALQRILAVVELERGRLQELLEQAGAPRGPAAVETARPPEAPVAFRLGGGEKERSGRNRYAGLKGFSTHGLSPRQIADQFNLPAGEFEPEAQRYGRRSV